MSEKIGPNHELQMRDVYETRMQHALEGEVFWTNILVYPNEDVQELLQYFSENYSSGHYTYRADFDHVILNFNHEDVYTADTAAEQMGMEDGKLVAVYKKRKAQSA